MYIQCLGCSGGYPSVQNGTSSFVVVSQARDCHLLVDAGSGAACALEAYMDVNQLDAVLVSHDHADHVADLGIVQHMFMLKPPGAHHAPVPIYLHQHSIMAPYLMEDPSSRIERYDEGTRLEIGLFRVTFCPTIHPIECYAMRIEEVETGQVVVYTADSAWAPQLVDFTEGADCLIADASLPNEAGANHIHMIAEEVARLASEAQVKHLIASHIAPHADAKTILNQIQMGLRSGIGLSQCQPGQIYPLVSSH